MKYQPNRLMGVLNVTPDSFSDGGQFTQLDAAVVQAGRMVAEGAQIIDIGGESTRPGAQRVEGPKEIARTVPVIQVLVAAEFTAQISIDTMNAQTALAAVATGASIINDVSGGLADPQMFAAVAQTGATYVLGHWRGHSSQMDALNSYGDVAADVAGELRTRVAAALAAGIDPGQIVLDPGLGFAKDAAQNWQLLAGLEKIKAIGFPLVIGASRKRFLAAQLANFGPGHGAAEIGNQQRDSATAALTALLAGPQIFAFRVHNVAANANALAVAAALSTGSLTQRFANPAADIQG